MLTLDKEKVIVVAEKYCHLGKGHETDAKARGNELTLAKSLLREDPYNLTNGNLWLVTGLPHQR